MLEVIRSRTVNPMNLGPEGACNHNIEDNIAFIDVFGNHGYAELDTARTSAGGTCEEILGAAK